MRVLLAALAVLAAGCAGSVEEPSAPAPEAPAEEGPAPGEGAAAPETAPEEDATPLLPSVLYLRGDGSLAPDEPSGEASARIPFRNPWTQLAQGGDFPAWRGPAAERDQLVTAARLTFFVTSEGASVTWGPGSGGLPEFFFWFGPDGAPMGGGSAAAADLVLKDQVVEVSVDLNVPAGGQVFRAGEVPYVMIGAAYLQDDAANRLVLLAESPATPSRLDLVAAPVALPEEGEHVPVLDESGRLDGDACQGPPTDGSVARFPVEVPADAVGFHAELARTGGTPGLPDLDLLVFDAAGEFVTSGHTPKGDEVVILHAPNLDAAGRGSWTLVVRSCAPQSAEFALKAWAVAPTSP